MNNKIEKLNDYFREKFKIDFLNENKELSSEHVFGPKIGISAVSLLYVYAFIEKELETKISETFILEEKFASFDSICTLFE